ASCPTGLVNCNGSCRDVSADANNCGGCGRACGTGGVCTSGVCGCAPGAITCGGGGRCIDPTTDPRNCGGCGKDCTGGLACVGRDAAVHRQGLRRLHPGDVLHGVPVCVWRQPVLSSARERGFRDLRRRRCLPWWLILRR